MSEKCLHEQPQMMNTPTDKTPFFQNYILLMIIWLPGWEMAIKALGK